MSVEVEVVVTDVSVELDDEFLSTDYFELKLETFELGYLNERLG